ncbi:(2Fe-2S)-binding protein [Phaeobacter sp. J2-8]|uniref:(2Fe-2S)-binding protein n=1 Tax=Phaeobacter sp. J2-8 TaxID=2931394 RepID=UPI001FD33569|nr:(2Fe-2S)-binding protein [Phaeobacter sp. J2-8]MCJ7871186.1 (2Fe-2S)-binding protein [Phaeobacter sp. J2-8]
MAEGIQFDVDGNAFLAQPGETVASAMLRLQLVPFRFHPVDTSPRGPFCMMGVCHECLIEVDGKPGQQACLLPVVPGMSVRRPLNG